MNGGRDGYYQLERLQAAGAQATEANGVPLDQAFLYYSNNKRASNIAVFYDWSSHEAAKNMVIEMHKDDQSQPILTMTQIPEKREITTNTYRIQKQ